MHLEELKNRDTLGDRMKDYEDKAISLDRSEDKFVMIRLDGNHFHTWVKQAGLKKPFDDRMIWAMQEAAKALCETIPTCVLGYVQSDEISLVLKKGENPNSEPWFSNRIQKLCSVSASIATATFNQYIQTFFSDEEKKPPLAYFDARVIFMPTLDECINCLIWRQNDCIKNSVSCLAQSLFPQKVLLKKNTDEQKRMMLEEKGVDWNALSTVKKLGTLVHKAKSMGIYDGKAFWRAKFFADLETPRFTESKQFLLDAYSFKLEEPGQTEA